MKTLKLVMIATFVSFAMVAFPNTVETLATKSIVEVPVKENTHYGKQISHLYMHITQAMTIPKLVDVMNKQLRSSMLDAEQRSYTVAVIYMSYVIHITGSYADWALFFYDDIVSIRVSGQKTIR